jgi:hypothetical protein
MLIIDEGTAKRHKQAKVVERTREVTTSGAYHEARDSRWVEDKKRSVANPEHQMGRRLTATEFMNKLRKINPDITMSPHPGVFAPKDSQFHKLNKDKAVLHLTTSGQKVFLFVVEGDYMPEWSTMATSTVRVPDYKPEGMWKPVEIPWHKTKRGWREVLIMLIHKHLIGLEAVEREFGAGNRPSWKILTGKGTGNSIF